MTAPSDKELRRLIKHFDGPLMHTTVAMARELLAARKVVRAAKTFRRKDTVVSVRQLGKAIDAYDKARKGKVRDG